MKTTCILGGKINLVLVRGGTINISSLGGFISTIFPHWTIFSNKKGWIFIKREMEEIYDCEGEGREGDRHTETERNREF